MRIGSVVTALVLGIVIGALATASASGNEGERRVFELRTYTTHDGKLDALHARFRDHTMRLFEKHGMTNVAYWTPQDPALAGKTLVYLLAHRSPDAAKRSWDAFRNDPEWQKVKAESEAPGPIVRTIESVFGDPTDYSPVK